MDDGTSVYGVLKKLYDGSLVDEKPDSFAKSLCEEERYRKTDTHLQRVGKKQTVYSIIHRLNVLNLSVLTEEAGKEEIKEDELDVIVADLKAKGLIYEPEPGVLGYVGD
jgi:hypothetical protein